MGAQCKLTAVPAVMKQPVGNVVEHRGGQEMNVWGVVNVLYNADTSFPILTTLKA